LDKIKDQISKIKNTDQRSKIIISFVMFCFVFIAFLTTACSYASEIKFPKPAGYVNDFAGVLVPSTETALNNLLVRLEKKTGAEMAVVTVKTVKPMDIDTYAVELFNDWKLGKKGLDNGVLIVFAKEDRKIKIETGKGIEGTLPDGYLGRVLDEQAVPAFKLEKYGRGLYNTAAVLSEKIQKDHIPGKPAKKKDKTLWATVIAILVFILAVSVAAMNIKKLGDKGGSALMGALIGCVIGFFWAGVIGAVFGVIIGLIAGLSGFKPGGYYGGGGMWGGGFGGGSFGGGGGSFGGFGGGGSGGGGAGRSF